MPTLPPEELELLDDELLDELELDDELEEELEELDEELLDELDEEDELLDELLLEDGWLPPPPQAHSAADTTVNMVQRAKRAEELIIYLPFVIGLAG